MIDKQLIANLKLVHGSYNAVIMFLFIYQGFLGLKIRRDRRTGTQAFDVIRRHRRLGPVLATLGIIGFFAGLILVYLDYGDILRYPLHLIAGMAIVSSITGTYLISKKIKAADLTLRTTHFIAGIIIICLYVIQAFIGLGMLL